MSPFEFSPIVRRAVFAVAVFTLASWALLLGTLLAWPAAPSRAAAALGRLAHVTTLTPDAQTCVAFANAGHIVSCGDDAGYAYGVESNDQEFSWALLDEDGNSTGENMNSRRVRSGARTGEARFWFVDQGDEYVVRDHALVEEVREATRPLCELGQQMGEVGSEMGRNGTRMGRIGGKMGQIGARMGAVQARLANRGSSRAARADIDAQMAALRAEMDKLRAQMDAEHRDHDGGQQELSKRMSELSAQQQQALKEARIKVREIAARARREGKAERPHANA